MGCSWYSPRSDHRSRGWRQSPTFRRVALYAADRAVPLFTNRRRPVTFSDHAQTLSALRGLHKIAADARPPSGVVSKQVASAALSSRVLPVGATRKVGVSSLDAPLLAVTQRRHPVDRTS